MDRTMGARERAELDRHITRGDDYEEEHGMRLRMTIKIPAETTVENVRDVEELLHGHGYPTVHLDPPRIVFEWEASDSEPEPLHELLKMAAGAEFEARSSHITSPAVFEDFEEVFAAALGVFARYEEVIGELKSHGWHDEPTIERVIA